MAALVVKLLMMWRRTYLAIAIGVTIAAGLASRKYPWLLPASLGKYPGDVLWAQMVYWSIGFVAPSAPVVTVATCALAISYADEFSQLYQAPWINNLRATTVGHLILGSQFGWGDILAYTVGVGICGVVHAVLSKTRPITKA